MNNQRITQLIEKHLEGKTSDLEYQELLDWYRSVNTEEVKWPETEEEFETRVNRIQENILVKSKKNISSNTPPKHILKYLIYTIGVAASIALFFIVLPLLKNTSNRHNLEDTKLLATADANIVPGGNKALLTLSDGSTIHLSDSISNYNNDSLSQFLINTKEGELTLTDKTSSSKLNTLSTPRSGQYIVNLPDGSKVWLNAESTLTFPSSFEGQERKVSLTGEGYFDIAKNKNAPFIVQVEDIKIEVLGTEFNINAYKDAPKLETTLVEGALKVSQGQQNVVLRPNEQSVWNKKNQKLSVQTIDTKSFTAWKDGYFVFENTPIKTIMSQLARWYDVDVVYLGDTNNKEYTGRILKRSNIQEVLDMLELTGTINFEITERRINVMP